MKERAMTSLKQAADEFLSQHRIAVAGVSRDSKQPANLIYRRLRDTGHDVSQSTRTPRRSRVTAAMGRCPRSRMASTAS
jgi:predicted CoA-binding protein